MLKDWQEVGLWGSVFHHIGQEMVHLIHISARVRLRTSNFSYWHVIADMANFFGNPPPTWTPYYSGSFNCNKHLDFHYFLLLLIIVIYLCQLFLQGLCAQKQTEMWFLLSVLSRERELKQCKQLTCGKGSGMKNAPLWYPFYSRLFKRWKINKRKTGLNF